MRNKLDCDDDTFFFAREKIDRYAFYKKLIDLGLTVSINDIEYSDVFAFFTIKDVVDDYKARKQNG